MNFDIFAVISYKYNSICYVSFKTIFGNEFGLSIDSCLVDFFFIAVGIH